MNDGTYASYPSQVDVGCTWGYVNGKDGRTTLGQVEVRYFSAGCMVVVGVTPDDAERMADDLRKYAAQVRANNEKAEAPR